MDDLTKNALTPTIRMDLTNVDLSQTGSLADLEAIWNNDIPSIVPHDCAVTGEAFIDASGITIKRIFFTRGVFNDEKAVLLARCSSLLATWNMMRTACLLDLGPCMCIGRRLFNIEQDETRRFLIHGQIESGNRILFLVFSSAGWKNESAVKRLISKLVPPMAQALARLAPMVNSIKAKEAGSAEVRLTAREVEIVSGLVEGKTNKEIARNLGTSPNTVRNQIARLAEKSGARNRAQLAALAASLRCQD